ncbi:hypothetical protein WQ54_05330 [Bacillus sp. SA1-12]|nr:hypothetical protein WQ54_05330 [Bacillus sp. SA1-12]
MKISVSKILIMIYSLYIFSFVTIFCSQLTHINVLINMHMLIQRACLLILIVLMVRNVFNKRMLFWVNIIVVVLLLVFKSNNGVLDLITVFVFAFSMKRVSFDKIVKADILVKGVACALVVMLALMGVIDSQISYSSRGILRTSLGFTHANILSLIILSLCINWMYLRFYKLKWFEYIILCLVVYGLYFTTNSLTSIIGISFLLTFNLLARLVKRLNIGYIPLSVFLTLIIPTVFSLSLFLAINYSTLNPTLVALNELTTGRVSSMNSFYNQYGISLFGKPIEMISTTAAQQLGVPPQVLDNGYMRLLLRFGLIITAIFLGLYIKLSFQLLKKRKFAIVSCLSAYFVVGLMESSFYRIEYNIFLLTMVYVFTRNATYDSLEVTDEPSKKKIRISW